MQDEKRRNKFNLLQRWENRLERFSESVIEGANNIEERRKNRAAKRKKKEK
jgi:hypothetical protein